tara:strand:+ start:14340 stop:15887 length:1548 start_codon:yes stop_codon:yes gene_type:complete
MADNNLDTLALILSEASDIYFKSKAMDFAAEQARTQQTNIEIDRQLGEERFEKELAVKALDSRLTRANKKLDIVSDEYEKARTNYQTLTGDVYKLPESNRTSGSTAIIGDMQQGSLGLLEQEYKDTSNFINQMEQGKNELLGRLGDITLMKNYLKGGASGFTGGDDPKIYDPGDFTIKGYEKARGIDVSTKPWLEQAHPAVTTTPAEIAALNKSMGLDPMSLIDVEYKRELIDATKARDEKTTRSNKGIATDKAYKSMYVSLQNSLNTFSDLKKQAAVIAGYTEEEKEGNPASYQKDQALLTKGIHNFTASIDPLAYTRITESLKKQNITLDMVRQYNRTGQVPDGLSEDQQRYIAKVSPTISKALETIYVEGFNAVEQLKGSSGIMGTGRDLLSLVRKRVEDYNSLSKTGKLKEAQQLAFEFERVTGIDVSSQAAIQELELKVSNEGFIPTEDPELRNIITADREEGVPFHLTADYTTLKAAVDADDRETARILIDQLIPKYGRAEVLDAIGGW